MSTAQILVVDDEAYIRTLLEEILTEEGYRVRVAADAEEARDGRLKSSPDLVLLDIWMPDTDGITLLREWAADEALTPCPVVMMSGHVTVETAIEATRLGAFDFIEKQRSLAQREMGDTKFKALERLDPALGQDPVEALTDFGLSVLQGASEMVPTMKILMTVVPLSGIEGISSWFPKHGIQHLASYFQELGARDPYTTAVGFHSFIIRPIIFQVLIFIFVIEDRKWSVVI